jgi:branched-chain amino acid transport system ATP-binding protein
VAIARALVSNREYLLCDEVSLGLSPLAVEDVYSLLAKLRRSGGDTVRCQGQAAP